MNATALFCTYGNTENFQRTAFMYFTLGVMHVTFSLREEIQHREAYLSEFTVHALKESFSGSLEALPAPILVQTQG